VGLDAEAAEYLFIATLAALKTYAEERARAPLAHAGASFRA
jgi:hypothetical protein